MQRLEGPGEDWVCIEVQDGGLSGYYIFENVSFEVQISSEVAKHS